MTFAAYADGWMDLPQRLARCALGRARVVAAGAKRGGDSLRIRLKSRGG